MCTHSFSFTPEDQTAKLVRVVVASHSGEKIRGAKEAADPFEEQGTTFSLAGGNVTVLPHAAMTIAVDAFGRHVESLQRFVRLVRREIAPPPGALDDYLVTHQNKKHKITLVFEYNGTRYSDDAWDAKTGMFEIAERPGITLPWSAFVMWVQEQGNLYEQAHRQA